MESLDKPKFNKQEWNQNNKDKIALCGRRYYEKMKQDPEFMALKRERAKARRDKLRELKNANKESIPKPIEEQQEKPKNPVGRPRKYLII